MACTFDASDPVGFPYEYRYPNGSLVTVGTIVKTLGHVPGFGSTPDPVCVFDTTACTQTHLAFPNGTAFKCCSATQELENSADIFLFPLIAFFAPFIVAQFFFRWLRAKRAAAAQAKADATHTPVAKAENRNPMAELLKGWSTCQKVALGLFFFISIGALVTESVIMPKSIQTHLPPSDRAAQLAMSSFLTPVAEVFRFLEDTMTVSVGYAVASGRFTELNALLHIGVLGGALSALIALGLTTIVAFTTASAEEILNPSSDPNDALIAAGCGLIPTTTQLLEHARPYWMLVSAAWVPKFASLSIFGFLTGTGQLPPQLFSMIVSGTVPIALWFGLLGTDMPALTILGVAYGSADWLLSLTYFGYFVYNKALRLKYKLKLVFCRRCFGYSRKGPRFDTRIWGRILREVVNGGVRIMVVDLAVQMSITVTIYLAASQHMETAYKLAAAQAAYWTFGPQYLVGTNMLFKIIGAQLIAGKKHKMFAGFFMYVGMMTLCSAIGAILAAALKGHAVANDFGQSACVFASDAGCAGTYAAIFGGDDALARVFDVFGPTVGLQLFFMLMRTGLAACHDFDYLWKAAVAAVVIAYIPAICVAHFVINTATSYYVAMYLPHFLMILLFGIRMWSNVRKLLSGKPGPWTEHIRRGSVILAGDDDAGIGAAVDRSLGDHSEYLLAGSDGSPTDGV